MYGWSGGGLEENGAGGGAYSQGRPGQGGWDLVATASDNALGLRHG